MTFKDRQSAINVLWACLMLAVPGADDPRPEAERRAIGKQVIGSFVLALEDLGFTMDEMKEAQRYYDAGMAKL